MNAPQVTEHIALLKDEKWSVRRDAAKALGQTSDASAVPALGEALKDKDLSVCHSASKALGQIGTPALSALIEALKDKDKDVRYYAALSLGKIGDSDTLPRKILADLRFSAQERINILEMLRRVRYKEQNITLRYTFPETVALCQAVLNEEDAKAHEGAQSVLNWLNGDRDLLIASQPDTTKQAQELVRPAQGGEFETQPKTLLRAADKSEKDVEPHPTRPTFRQRLFRKRK